MTDPDLTSPTPHILFVPTQEAALRSLVLAADALVATGRFEATFVLTPRLAASAPDLSHRTEVLALPDGVLPFRASQPEARIARAAYWTSMAVEKRIRERTAELVAWRAAAARLLDDRPAQLVVASDDRLGGAYAALLAEAGTRSVPRLALSYALSRAVGSVRTRTKWRSHTLGSRPLRRLKARIAAEHPGQVHEHDGTRYLFHGPEPTLALSRAEMLAEQPWVMGGGLSDAAVLATPEDADYVAGFGVDPARLHVLGDLSLDALHHAWRQRDSVRERLSASFTSSASLPIAVVAVPQLAEQGVASREEGDRAARAVVEPLRGRARVVVSLHPKCDPNHYTKLLAADDVTIAAEPLHAILPAAGLFVAGFSSTVRWAVRTGIPTVVADLGWWGYDLYDDLAGVVTVRDASEYERVTGELLADAERRVALGRAHAPAAAAMGPFDGCVGERLAALVGSMVGEDPPAERA